MCLHARECPDFSPIVESVPVTEDRTPRRAKIRPKPSGATTGSLPRPGRLPAGVNFDQLPPKGQTRVVRVVSPAYEGSAGNNSGGNNDQGPPLPGKTAIC